MWIPVPWAVEGGAAVPVEAARILAYAATQGNEGIVGALDLKVTPTSPGSSAVNIATGAAVIRCRTAGFDYQTYIGSRPIADDTLALVPNTAASIRSDLIVARVENPWLSGEPWQAPTDVANGPYIGARALQGVPSSAVVDRNSAIAYLRSQGMSAIPLASIVWPASTTVVSSSMIADLRTVANPRRVRQLFTYQPPSRINAPTTWADWIAPSGWLVDVPEWATRVTVNVSIFGAKLDKQSTTVDGNVYGQLRALVGDGDGATSYTQAAAFDFDAPKSSGATRAAIGVADYMAVSTLARGTRRRLKLQTGLGGGNQPLYVNDASSVTFDLEFSELAA